MSKQDIILGILLYFFGFISYPIIFLLRMAFEDYIYDVAHREEKEDEKRKYRWE
jgi:hypothetical protein